MKLYQSFDVNEETPVQWLAVHPLRWRPEWGKPAIMFREVDEKTQALSDAAPEMLAVCEGALEMTEHLYDTFGETHGDVYPMIALLRAALAKARGK